MSVIFIKSFDHFDPRHTYIIINHMFVVTFGCTASFVHLSQDMATLHAKMKLSHLSHQDISHIGLGISLPYLSRVIMTWLLSYLLESRHLETND